MRAATVTALCLAAVVCVIDAQFREEETPGNEMVKRKSAYMRFGRSDPEMAVGPDDEELAMEKRKSAYMRFGKRAAETEEAADVEKRKSAYMRFGKRKSAYMRFGKRSALPEFDSADESLDMEKRKSAYMSNLSILEP